MIAVNIVYPNQQSEEVLLAGVPRKGDHLRLANGMTSPSLVVELVTWMEGSGDVPKPTVMVSVRPRAEGSQ